MKNSGLNIFIYSIIIIVALFVTILITELTFKLHNTTNNSVYKVYYEYDIIDQDTIPVDTIYIQIKP